MTPTGEPWDDTGVPTPYDDGESYDLIFDGLDYGIDFYLGLGRAATGPILDVTCGTGRVLLPLLRAGLDVDGSDLFPAMLARLAEKAEKEGFRPYLKAAAMAGLSMPRQYGLVIIPFNAFVHNLTADDQIATLVRCREHLLPAGQLAFDTFFPGAALITMPGGIRDLELETTHPGTGHRLKMYDTRSFDRVTQLMQSRIEIEEWDASGTLVGVRRSRTTIRWIYRHEMELLLRIAGFRRWQITGGFGGGPLEKDTDAMVVQAWV